MNMIQHRQLRKMVQTIRFIPQNVVDQIRNIYFYYFFGCWNDNNISPSCSPSPRPIRPMTASSSNEHVLFTDNDIDENDKNNNDKNDENDENENENETNSDEEDDDDDDDEDEESDEEDDDSSTGLSPADDIAIDPVSDVDGDQLSPSSNFALTLNRATTVRHKSGVLLQLKMGKFSISTLSYLKNYLIYNIDIMRFKTIDGDVRFSLRLVTDLRSALAPTTRDNNNNTTTTTTTTTTTAAAKRQDSLRTPVRSTYNYVSSDTSSRPSSPSSPAHNVCL
jgi:hypothetical protein